MIFYKVWRALLRQNFQCITARRNDALKFFDENFRYFDHMLVNVIKTGLITNRELKNARVDDKTRRKKKIHQYSTHRANVTKNIRWPDHYLAFRHLLITRAESREIKIILSNVRWSVEDTFSQREWFFYPPKHWDVY